MVKRLPAMHETGGQSLGQEDPLEKGIATDSSKDLPGGSDSKASVYNVGDLGSIPGLGRSPGEGNGNPLQYYCLDGQRSLIGYSPWGRKESDTTERLHSLTDSSILAWRIPWTEEPSGVIQEVILW